MRVIFMGTPDFAVPALTALHQAGHEIAAVYTQPPRPAGRGKKHRPSPVHHAAEAMSLVVRHPVSLRACMAIEEFAQFTPDVAVVAAYGLILPQQILEQPAHGCINIHASLLPRWRGAAPIHRAIMAGDTHSGISIMQMQAGLDTGPVLMARPTPIGAEETTAELHDRLARMGADMIVETLSSLGVLVPKPQPQPAEGVIYADKIKKAETRVRWDRPAQEVDRFIRGLSPFPGAWTDVEGERVKLLRSRVGTAGSGDAGEVLEMFTIACAEGCVEILQVQREGKKTMPASEVLRGFALPARLI